jgi:hypothetical protein
MIAQNNILGLADSARRNTLFHTHLLEQVSEVVILFIILFSWLAFDRINVLLEVLANQRRMITG